MKKPTDFSYYVSTFLTDYLAGVCNLSTNTIASYRDAFVLLLTYMQNIKEVAPSRITIANVNRETVESFMLWLEDHCGNSISTRNQRLAAIHAFFRYLQGQEPQYMFQSQTILAIPRKRAVQPTVKYLSAEQTGNLLMQVDVSETHGLRDLALLSLMYDSGARVQEIADLKVRDIRVETPPVVRLTGKGRKTRTVPLMVKTSELLSKYMVHYSLATPDKLADPLFCNRQGKKLTRQGITYILQKYAVKTDVGSLTPHILRHTKAMHLTEAGVNPVYIRDILGHADLKTTDIYAKANTEMKRAALCIANNNVVPAASAKWNEDKDLMVWLTSLGK